jgi:hypothetical protein
MTRRQGRSHTTVGMYYDNNALNFILVAKDLLEENDSIATKSLEEWIVPELWIVTDDSRSVEDVIICDA